MEPSERNGLHSSARLMVDKITTVAKSKVGERIGRLDDEDMVRLKSGRDGVPRPSCVAENRQERVAAPSFGPKWRATPDSDDHYVFAVAL